MTDYLPVLWEGKYICSDCFEEQFPDTETIGTWSPTVLNFSQTERCWFCYRPSLMLDTLNRKDFQ